MNSFVFAGRVVADPELKKVGESDVLGIRLATDSGFGDKKTTLWVKGDKWGKGASGLAGILKKGMQVTVKGELTGTYAKAKEGGEIGVSLNMRIEDIALPPKSQGSSSEGGAESEPAPKPKTAPKPPAAPKGGEEDMPF